MTRRSVERLLAWVSYALAASLLVLVAARYLGLPVAAAVVAGKSMEPSIRFGDLVLLEKVEDPRVLKPGEVVLWCTSPRSCVLHRLVEVHDGVAVTKGDANPYPDPPVPVTAVRYRAVLVLPRELYAIPMMIYIILSTINSLRRVSLGEASQEAIYAATLLAYSAALFLAPLAAPSQPLSRDVFKSIAPAAYLKRVELEMDGSIVAEYVLNNTEVFHPLPGCVMQAGQVSAPCMVVVEEAGRGYARARVVPARGFYLKAYLAGAGNILVKANISLGNALLEARITTSVSWRPPTLRQRGCSIVIENPNPGAAIPIKMNLTIYRLGRGPAGTLTVVSTETLEVKAVLPPGGSREIPLPPSSRAVAKVAYPAPGGGAGEASITAACLQGG